MERDRREAAGQVANEVSVEDRVEVAGWVAIAQGRDPAGSVYAPAAERVCHINREHPATA
jgi:hypothetical protein